MLGISRIARLSGDNSLVRSYPLGVMRITVRPPSSAGSTGTWTNPKRHIAVCSERECTSVDQG